MDRPTEGDGARAHTVLRSVRVLQKEMKVSCQLREGTGFDSSQTCTVFVHSVAELLSHPQCALAPGMAVWALSSLNTNSLSQNMPNWKFCKGEDWQCFQFFWWSLKNQWQSPKPCHEFKEHCQAPGWGGGEVFVPRKGHEIWMELEMLFSQA